MYRKKIVGGSIFGDIAKIGKDGLLKVFRSVPRLFHKAKPMVTKAIQEKATEKAEELSKKAFELIVKPGIEKALAKTHTKMVQPILKKVPEQIRKIPLISENSRAILSNLIAGSGFKKI